MSTKGAEYILRCNEFGEEQWAQLIALRVERMRPHFKDIAAAKLELIPLLRSSNGGAWASLRDRKDPNSTYYALDLRGIFYVVRNRPISKENLPGYAYNATDAREVPPNHIFVFGLTHSHLATETWSFVDIEIESKQSGTEYPLTLTHLFLPPRAIARKAGVSLAWIFEGLHKEASRWESARDRLLQEARRLTDDLEYEHHVVWDVWHARQERALAGPADPTS